MGKTDDIVNGCAAFRCERRVFRIGQIQRGDMIENSLHAAVNRAFNHIFVGGMDILDPLGNHSLINGGGIRHQGDEFSVLQNMGGAAGIENRRHPEFTGHRGQMAGHAADIGNDSPNFSHQHGMIGRRKPGHQNGIRRNWLLVIASGQENPADSHAA